MVFVTLYFAYWRWGRSINDADHMMVTIYRVSQIPTPKMMEEDNATHTAWDNSTRWANQFYLHENGMKVNFATLVLSFFAISAVFHLLACILGAFERWYVDSLPTTLFRISCTPSANYSRDVGILAVGFGFGVNSTIAFLGGGALCVPIVSEYMQLDVASCVCCQVDRVYGLGLGHGDGHRNQCRFA